MRTYGKVSFAFWTDAVIVGLSGDAQRLALYLLTGPQSNALGCFRLPLGYLSEDFQANSRPMEAAELDRLFDELEAVGFIIRDKATGWTLLLNYLVHNPPENGNVGKAMVSIINGVPRSSRVWPEMVRALRLHAAERLPAGFLDKLDGGAGAPAQPAPVAPVAPATPPTPQFSPAPVAPVTVPLPAAAEPPAPPCMAADASSTETVSHTVSRGAKTIEPNPDGTGAGDGTQPSEPIGSGAGAPFAAPDPLDKQVFDRGKALLGAKSGGMITKLRRRFDNDDQRVLAVLELAGTKNAPPEYLGRIIAGDPVATAETEIAEIRRGYERMGGLL